MYVAFVSTYQHVQATYLHRSLSQAYSIALLLEVPDSPTNQVRPDSCPADFEKKSLHIIQNLFPGFGDVLLLSVRPWRGWRGCKILQEQYLGI